MKRINYSIIIIIWSIIFNGCTVPEKKAITLASEDEMKIINEMTCWESYINEIVILQITHADSEKEKDKLWKEWHSNLKEATKKGQLTIANDSIFISCIRDQANYKSLLNKRKLLAKSLLTYKYKLPKFDKFINKIMDGVIEYNYNGIGGFGVYEREIQQKYAIYIGHDTFYKDYSGLLKEAYIENTSSTIKDEFIVSLNKLLSEIEEIDRHIWPVPYYDSKLSEFKKEQLFIEKDKKVNELID